MRAPIVLDTGGWLLALAGESPYERALEEASYALVPGLVLAEVDWHLRRRRKEMHRVLSEVAAGAYRYEPPTLRDLERAREIDAKFDDLAIGLVDATVAALAERLDVRRLLTTDSDFAAIRIGRRWNQALELAVPLPSRR